MALIERVMGVGMTGDETKLSAHTVMAAMQEYALGRFNGAQVTAALGLDAAAQAEATAMLGVINAEASTNGAIARRVKAVEFERILMLAEQGILYTTPAAVRTRLGI